MNLEKLLNQYNISKFNGCLLLQVFHCHFNSNFFPLFLEVLLGNSISQTTCSIILGKKKHDHLYWTQTLNHFHQIDVFLLQVSLSWRRTSTTCTSCRCVVASVCTQSFAVCSVSSSLSASSCFSLDLITWCYSAYS